MKTISAFKHGLLNIISLSSKLLLLLEAVCGGGGGGHVGIVLMNQHLLLILTLTFLEAQEGSRPFSTLLISPRPTFSHSSFKSLPTQKPILPLTVNHPPFPPHSGYLSEFPDLLSELVLSRR